MALRVVIVRFRAESQSRQAALSGRLAVADDLDHGQVQHWDHAGSSRHLSVAHEPVALLVRLEFGDLHADGALVATATMDGAGRPGDGDAGAFVDVDAMFLEPCSEFWPQHSIAHLVSRLGGSSSRWNLARS